MRRAQTESQMVYGNTTFYLEKVIAARASIGVQVLARRSGPGGASGRARRLVAARQSEDDRRSARALPVAGQREQLWQMALELARLFGFRSVGTIEFMGDQDGHFYFTEIKPRIQIEHPVTEMISAVDLVREQIRTRRRRAAVL